MDCFEDFVSELVEVYRSGLGVGSCVEAGGLGGAFPGVLRRRRLPDGVDVVQIEDGSRRGVLLPDGTRYSPISFEIGTSQYTDQAETEKTCKQVLRETYTRAVTQL